MGTHTSFPTPTGSLAVKQESSRAWGVTEAVCRALSQAWSHQLPHLALEGGVGRSGLENPGQEIQRLRLETSCALSPLGNWG